MSNTNNNNSNGDPSLSLASKHYLRKENDLGDAILHLTCTKDASHFIAEIYEKAPLRYVDGIPVQDLNPPSEYNAAKFIEKRFKHGFRQLTRKGCLHPIYEIPATDYSVQLITEAWTNPKIISDVAKPIFQRVLMREFEADLNAQRVAEWRKNGTVPTNKWFDEHDKHLAQKGIELNGKPIVLNPYQKLASFNACMSPSGYGLLAKPGLGKTAMMIRILDYVIDHSKRETMTLILCPKNIRSNWINEIQKFSTNYRTSNEEGKESNKIYITTLQGNNPIDRIVNFTNDVSKDEAIGKHVILISSFESFVQTEHIHAMEFDLCLLDESHNIANPNTKRTKTLLATRNNFHKRIIATGSFIRNTPFDSWTQLEFIGAGISGFDTYNSHKEFYGEFTEPNKFQTMRRLDGFKNIPLMQEKLAKYTFIIDKEEALPFLPQKTFSIQECNLSKEQYKVYMAVQEQLFAEIESYGPEPDSITVNNILTQMLRLAQITSGYAATDQGLRNVFDPNPKLDLLVRYLLGSTANDNNGNDENEQEGVLEDKNRKAIVWCCFKENLKMINARLKLEGIESVMFHGTTEDKDDVVDMYNKDPDTRVFIGIAASGGVGLNLVGFDPYNPDIYPTNTTDTIIYSSNWSMVNRMQAIDRAHRHITRVPQHIVDLIVPGSIDTTIYKRLEYKSEVSISIQDIKSVLSQMIPQVNGA